ncbi:gamma-glutamylcyclotransferase-like isoform X1 [Frankliniella occidentalis]|uniref:gamma-glutamylcyclotransferase n=1 Tax=Frankliniella occidentalis TaxID=133901 RepID=A0A6J1SHT0_FRAOC|nr:gamma-glutamylcyclotransferase-like isoform X1 [Frankliniella occidentalis]
MNIRVTVASLGFKFKSIYSRIGSTVASTDSRPPSGVLKCHCKSRNPLKTATLFCSATDSATSATTGGGVSGVIPGDGPGDGKFLYFAYGSNLLARRLHLMNPTAQRHGIGELRDYRLDFSTPASKRWGGAPATVVPDPGESVWGAIWSLDIEDRDHLDEQESVGSGLYDVFNATVRVAGGGVLQCRCYLMREVPPRLAPGEARPAARQPSLVYKQVLLHGARESGLPAEYVERMQAVQDNGSAGASPPISLDSLQQQQPAQAAC